MASIGGTMSTVGLISTVACGAYVIVRGPAWQRAWLLTIVAAVAAVALIALALALATA